MLSRIEIAKGIFTHREGLGGLANLGTRGFLDSFVADPLQGTIRFPSLTLPPEGVASLAEITMQTARLTVETAAHFDRTAFLMLEGGRLLRQERPSGPFDLPLATTGGAWTLAYWEEESHPTLRLKRGYKQTTHFSYERIVHLTRESDRWHVSVSHGSLSKEAVREANLSMEVYGDRGMVMTHRFGLQFLGAALAEARRAIGLPGPPNHSPEIHDNTSVRVLGRVIASQYGGREAMFNFTRERGTGRFVSLPRVRMPPGYERAELCPWSDCRNLLKAEFHESTLDMDMLRVSMHRDYNAPPLWGLNPALVELWKAAGGTIPEDLAG